MSDPSESSPVISIITLSLFCFLQLLNDFFLQQSNDADKQSDCFHLQVGKAEAWRGSKIATSHTAGVRIEPARSDSTPRVPPAYDAGGTAEQWGRARCLLT